MRKQRKKPFNRKRAWGRIFGVLQKGTRVRVNGKHHQEFSPVWCYDGWKGTVINRVVYLHSNEYWNILFERKDNFRQIDEKEYLTFKERDLVII